MPADRAIIQELLSRIHLFRNVDGTRIQQAIDLMEEVQVPAGKVIFQQNDDPDYFYFIFEGKVRVSRYYPQERQFRQMGFLEKYDYFGHEVLETDWPRQVTVETDSDVTLLRLSVANFVNLLEIIPELSQALQMVLDSYKLMLTTHFIWHDTEEMIYFISRRHVLFMVKKILPPLVFGAVAIPLAVFFWLTAPTQLIPISLLLLSIVVTLVWLVLAYIDWTNDYFIVTDRRVVYVEKVLLLYDSRLESPLSAIQSTSSSTTQWGRIFHYGNVAIRTMIGTVLFRDVPTPELVMALIQEQQTRTRIQEIYTNQADIQKRIGDRIRKGPFLPAYPKSVKVHEKPSEMHHFLATMFHTRYEENGVVTYRTHWFILLKRIWLPSLFTLGLIGMVVYSAIDPTAVLSLGTTCGLGGLAGFFVFIWWFYQYLDWHNDVYLITNDQIVDVYKKPLGQEDRQSAPLGNILSIESKRLGLIGRILNFGTVYIRVGDQTLTFDDVPQPSEVQHELFDCLIKKRNQEKQKTSEDNLRHMADWVAGYDEFASKERPTPEPPPPSRPGF